jgi:aspartyl protease family protein
MNGDTGVDLIWAIGALALVGSSLAARRLPVMASVKMALAWVAIFAVLYVMFLFKDEGAEIWRRATADITGSRGVVAGQSLRIPKGADGHFHVIAQVNGRDVEFLIDSGASVTTLSPEVARAVGVDSDGGPPVAVMTANGPALTQPARARSLRVGTIDHRDEPVQISGLSGAENLLGMSFLSSLKSVKTEGNTLTLDP